MPLGVTHRPAAPQGCRRPSASAARSPPASRSAPRHGCQLIVNDYWREAIELGADYVHLGQEDLAGADVPPSRPGGIRLGISTHSHEELEIALAAKPDYVALGPDLRDQAQGHEMGARRGSTASATGRRRIGALPLVAIGGITPERADGRGRGRRRQRRRDHRFLHPPRPRGARAPVAGVGVPPCGPERCWRSDLPAQQIHPRSLRLPHASGFAESALRSGQPTLS